MVSIRRAWRFVLVIVLGALWFWLLMAALAASVPYAAGAGTGSSAAATSPPIGLPARLTLSEALRIFRTQGLDVLLADAAVESARGELRV